MNYQNLVKKLIAEARGAIQYKKLEQPWLVLTIVAMLPIMAVCCLLIGFYYALLFLYNAMLSPVSYLESWLDERKEGIMHATQAVLYFVALPFIFFCRVILSIISFFFYFLWFELMVFTYLATLGGVRWQPFINTATFDKEYSWKLAPGETGRRVYTIASFSLLVLWISLWLTANITGSLDMLGVANVVRLLYLAVVIIVNPIIFKKQEYSECETNVSGENANEEATEAAAEVDTDIDL